jgi:radical SAM superfamily enzyme YgiQ (UPF0313 family)
MKRSNRVILVYPSKPEENKRPDRPPLGILTIAAPLLEKGMEVTVLDERAEPDFDRKLCDELKKGPLCVGVSSMSGNHITGALRVSRLVKELSAIPVVWGGVHASLEPGSTIANRFVDIIVRDDGENTFPRLLDMINNSAGDLSGLPGIGFKKNGQIIMTGPGEPANIESVPLIPFDLVDLDNYRSRDLWCEGEKVLPVETSRGCPFSCSFCTESVRKKKWRALPPERVVEDIKAYIRKYGVTNFTFIDDNFFGNIKRAESILDLLIKENVGIKWYTNARTDYIARATPATIEKIERSGCRMLTFGAESGSERILKMVNKFASKEDVLHANRKLRGLNIIPHFVTIQGFPGETKKDTIETIIMNIDLLIENERAICDSPFLIPTPGTAIAKECLADKAGEFTLEDWSRIFEMKNKGRPAWLDGGTYEFLCRWRKVIKLICITNRAFVPKALNALYRAVLGGIRVYLKSK